METMIIGKPALNIYLPLEDTLKEGDVFSIDKKIESVGNLSAVCACLFKKWKVNAHISGVVGNDPYAEKIRNVLAEYKVNVKYIETSYTTPTSANYIVLNSKTGISSKILFNDNNSSLTKFKYDFVPDFAVLDGSDITGSLGFLNSYPTVDTILFANKLDKELITLSKRVKYTVSTQTFAEAVAKEACDGTVEGYISVYQKIVDVTGKSNYIIILNNHKILYSVNGQVKMLPEAKMNLMDSSSFDTIFVSTFAYGISNNISIDDSIKLANTAASLSLSKMGEVDAIPSIDEVLDNSGLREKLGMTKKETNTVIEPLDNTLNPNVNVQNTANQNEEVQASAPVNQNEEVQASAPVNQNEEVQASAPVNQNVEAQPSVQPNPTVANENIVTNNINNVQNGGSSV